MILLKYTLISMLAILSTVSSVEIIDKCPMTWTAFKKWMSTYKPLRHPVFYIVFLFAGMTVAITAIDDYSDGSDRLELNGKIDTQSKMICEQQLALSKQRDLLYEQEKLIGSIVFNTKTSVDGKERFLQCFRDLARIAAVDANNTGFEGLVCEDGVAIYWFDIDTETITGFYFFSNAEINRVLGGMPLGGNLFDDSGVVKVSADSELAIAFRECLFRKLPVGSNNAIEADKAVEDILKEIETLIRYVYRAESIGFISLYPEGHTFSAFKKPLGSYLLTFQYAVDPYADKIWYRGVGIDDDIVLSKAFIESLHGLTMAEFSERVIGMLRSRRVDPKVRIREIRILESARRKKVKRDDSPFVKKPNEVKGA